MTEIFDPIWNGLGNYLNISYLCTFMLIAYMIKTYFKTTIELKLKKTIKSVYIVLIIATVLAIPYLILKWNEWEKILFSYTLGTSLHELFFNYIEDKLKKKV